MTSPIVAGQPRLPATIRCITLGLSCNAALALPVLWALWPAVPLAFLGCAAALAWSDLCVLPVVAGRRRFSPYRMLGETGLLGIAYALGGGVAYVAGSVSFLVTAGLIGVAQRAGASYSSQADQVLICVLFGIASTLMFFGGWFVVWLSEAFLRKAYGHEPRRWSARGGGITAVLLMSCLAVAEQMQAPTSLVAPLVAVLLAGLPWLVVTVPGRVGETAAELS